MQFRSQTCRQEVRHAVEKSAMQSAMQKSAMKEQHKFQEGNIVKIQNTHQVEMGIVIIFKFMEVIEIVIEIVEWARVVTNKKEKGKERNIALPGDINMSVEVVRTAIVEVVRTAIMEVVRTATVELVRTAITKGEYNTAEIKKNLTVKKGDINMFEDIHMMNVNIIKFVEMVKKVFYTKFKDIHMRNVVIFKFKEVVRMIINKKEYNTVEMQEELIVKEKNIIMLEDTNMRDRVIFKFVSTERQR
jgi:hypothetical protein